MKKLMCCCIVIVFSNCSAKFHLDKAIKKGYTCEQTTDTLRIYAIDSFPVIVGDTFVYEKYFTVKDTVIKYKTVYLPKTKYQDRIEWRERKEIIRTTAKASVKKDNLFLMGLIVGSLSVIILFLLGKKILHL
jgi:hypothetical protein